MSTCRYYKKAAHHNVPQRPTFSDTKMATSNDKTNGVANGLAKQRTSVSIHVSQLPGSLPTSQVPSEVNLEEVAFTQLQKLLSLSQDDLLDTAMWRDLMALTGTYRTFYSSEKVMAAWTGTSGCQTPVDLTLVPSTARVFKVLDVSSWIDAEFTFNVSADGPQRFCSGIISLALDQNGQWKIWMIRTMLDGIEGYGNVDVLEPAVSPEAVAESISGEHGIAANGRKYEDIPHFDVVVVGGGQAGLGVGGRLHALDVSYLIIDKFDLTGDSWDSRYDSTKREVASS